MICPRSRLQDGMIRIVFSNTVAIIFRLYAHYKTQVDNGAVFAIAWQCLFNFKPI